MGPALFRNVQQVLGSKQENVVGSVESDLMWPILKCFVMYKLLIKAWSSLLQGWHGEQAAHVRLMSSTYQVLGIAIPRYGLVRRTNKCADIVFPCIMS